MISTNDSHSIDLFVCTFVCLFLYVIMFSEIQSGSIFLYVIPTQPSIPLFVQTRGQARKVTYNALVKSWFFSGIIFYEKLFFKKKVSVEINNYCFLSVSFFLFKRNLCLSVVVL